MLTFLPQRLPAVLALPRLRDSGRRLPARAARCESRRTRSANTIIPKFLSPREPPIVNVMSADVSLRPVAFAVCLVETAGNNESVQCRRFLLRRRCGQRKSVRGPSDACARFGRNCKNQSTARKENPFLTLLVCGLRSSTSCAQPHSHLGRGGNSPYGLSRLPYQ